MPILTPFAARKMNASQLTRIDPAIVMMSAFSTDSAESFDLASLDPAIAAVGARTSAPHTMMPSAPSYRPSVPQARREPLGSLIARSMGASPTPRQGHTARLDSLARSRAPWPPRVPSLIPYSPPSRASPPPRPWAPARSPSPPDFFDPPSPLSSEPPESLSSEPPSPVSPGSAVSPRTRIPAPLARGLPVPGTAYSPARAPTLDLAPFEPVLLHSPEPRFAVAALSPRVVVVPAARHESSCAALSTASSFYSDTGLLPASRPLEPFLCGLAPAAAGGLVPLALRRGWTAARSQAGDWLHALADAVAGDAAGQGAWRAQMGRDEEQGHLVAVPGTETYVVGEEPSEDDGYGKECEEEYEEEYGEAQYEEEYEEEYEEAYEAEYEEEYDEDASATESGSRPDSEDERWVARIAARIQERDRRRRDGGAAAEAWGSSSDEGLPRRPSSCPTSSPRVDVRKNRFLRA